MKKILTFVLVLAILPLFIACSSQGNKEVVNEKETYVVGFVC